MSKRKMRVDPLNGADYMQNYRNTTAKMQFYNVPKMVVCPKCKKRRTYLQYIEESKLCEACRLKGLR